MLLDATDDVLVTSPLIRSEGARRELGVSVVPLESDAPPELAELKVRTPACLAVRAAVELSDSLFDGSAANRYEVFEATAADNVEVCGT